MNFIVAARRLMSELVAREIKNLEALLFVLAVQILKSLVLRCKSTAGCRVHDHQYFSLIICQINFFTQSVFYFEIINIHFKCPFLLQGCARLILYPLTGFTFFRIPHQILFRAV